MGLDAFAVYENTPNFSLIDDSGNVLTNTLYSNDTVDAIEVYSSNSYSLKNNTITISGNYMLYNKGYTLYPLLMFFNEQDYSLDSIKDFRKYFGEKSARLKCHLERDSENIIICGYVQYSLDANIRTYFGIYNNIQDTLYYKDYTRPINCIMTPYQIHPTSDGGYILACEQDITNNNPEKVYACLLKVDSVGNEMWRYVIPGQTGIPPYPDFEAATYRPRVFDAPDGNYFVTWTDPYLITNLYLYVNPQSTIRIAKLIDNGESCEFLDERDLKMQFDNPETNYYLINDSYQDANGDMYLLFQNYWGVNSALAKIHSNGVGAWLRTYRCYPDDDADSNYTQLYGLTKTLDGGFMLAGEFRTSSSTLFPGGIQSSLVIKVDSCGCLDAEGCNEHCADSYAEYFITMAEASVFPNPASDKITVSFEYEGAETEFTYKIYSLNAQLLQEGVSSASAPLQNENCNFEIYIEDLPSDFYTIQTWGGGKIFTGKFVKE
jgi:hypothetical protein